MSNYTINIENICTGVKVKKERISDLAQTVLLNEGVLEAEISIVIVDDEYIIRLNQEYLNKNTTTDVLSFRLTDDTGDKLEGEVYANIEQITRQASDYHVLMEDEISRIVIHGVLHLLGFDDQTGEQKKIMTEKEDQYLEILNNKLKKRG